ncbi:NGG1p interacting factor 3 protein, NIF3 [Desulfurobacterium thermolithotrophum DSM 11699]|uniref:NGG1p interacting factor 3 protein, NIF3 n=1 Tax=Desulfurobacterium thermolithotrophum (strain DSM 11699 / BSA) TaxID=868864 RepID=F0S2C0_DESTD|nr:Nif3-like dinuclear metal center hexameric protein [Desulfurobacterium thermolithotrophum]ADY74135.1 NGG1p interacting factor 3 protein, NIF3 [Desulfurobacterium thermolithotrophum DSM 11699]
MSLNWKEFESFLNDLVPKTLALPEDFYGWVNKNRPKTIEQVAVVVDFIPNRIPLEKFDVVISHHFPSFIPKVPVFVVHTPLDRIDWGCNFQLGKGLNIKNLSFIDKKRLGMKGIRKVNTFKLLEEVSKKLNAKYLRYFFPKEEIETIAIFSGCGLNFLPFIEKIEKEKVNLVISGDLTHHVACRLKSLNIGFIDISHYKSEVPGVKELTKRINQIVNAEFVDVGEAYFNVCFC